MTEPRHNTGTATQALPVHDVTLFYGAPQDALPADLGAALAAQVAALGLPLLRVRFARTALGFAGPSLGLVILAAGRPIPAAPYRGATRPKQPLAAAEEVAQRLARHGGAVRIRARGSEAARLSLCYAAAGSLIARRQPSLIHWGASGRLYTAVEFLDACGPTPLPGIERADPRVRSIGTAAGPHPRNAAIARLRAALEASATTGRAAA